MDDSCFLPVWELARCIRSRVISPVQVVETHLERIEKYNPILNAFITVCAEDALAAAHAAEQEIAGGLYRGPLHGVPFGVKDIIDTAGVRTTHGSSFFRENIPSEDAECVRRLKEAGAILIGKCNTHEFATASTTKNPHYGAGRNPWDPSRVPGGSSGGSGAAAAAYLSPFALGSETGGSTRGPAAVCGVMGLKPTYGRISIRGVFPHTPTMDHVGLLTRTVRDCAIVLQGIAGYDALDMASADVLVPDFSARLEDGVKGMRLGLCPDLVSIEIDAAVMEAFERAVELIRGLGARLETLRFPHIEKMVQVRQTIVDAELIEVHQERFAAHPEGYGEDVRARLERASRVTLDEYVRARREALLLRRAMVKLFRPVEGILLPGFPVVAAPVDTTMANLNGKEVPYAFLGSPLAGPHTMTGFPAMVVPTGFSPEGLPVSLQIVSSPWEEGRIFRIANAYEKATPETRERRPTMD